MMGIDVTKHHISTAHRLPSTKEMPNRIIVKFVHRDRKDEFFKRRSKLTGKKSKDILVLLMSMENQSTSQTKSTVMNC